MEKNTPSPRSGVLSEIFSFPHPVNEYAARAVAFMVMILTKKISIELKRNLVSFLLIAMSLCQWI